MCIMWRLIKDFQSEFAEIIFDWPFDSWSTTSMAVALGHAIMNEKTTGN